MEALRRHPRNFIFVLGARLAENGLGYLFPVFGLNYVVTTLGVPRADALGVRAVAIGELNNVLFGSCPADRRQSQEQQYQRGQATKRRTAMNIHVSCFSMKRVPEGDGGRTSTFTEQDWPACDHHDPCTFSEPCRQASGA